MRNLCILTVFILLAFHKVDCFQPLDDLLSLGIIPAESSEKNSFPVQFDFNEDEPNRKLLTFVDPEKNEKDKHSFEVIVSKQVGNDGQVKSEFEETKQFSLPNGQVVTETLSKPFDSSQVTVKRKVSKKKAKKQSPDAFTNFLQSMFSEKSINPAFRKLRAPFGFADFDENRSFLPVRTHKIRHRRVRIRKTTHKITHHKRISKPPAIPSLIAGLLNSVPNLATHRLDDEADIERYSRKRLTPLKTRRIRIRRVHRKKRCAARRNRRKIRFNNMMKSFFSPVVRVRKVIRLKKRYPKFSGFPLLNSFYGASKQRRPLVFPKLGHRRRNAFTFSLVAKKPKSLSLKIGIRRRPRASGLGLAQLLAQLGPLINPI